MENGTPVKSVKITFNIFAVRCALGEKTRMNEPAHQDANHEVCSVKKS